MFQRSPGPRWKFFALPVELDEPGLSAARLSSIASIRLGLQLDSWFLLYSTRFVSSYDG